MLNDEFVTNSELVQINKEELKKSIFLSHFIDKLSLLIEYENNAVSFYHDKVYRFTLSDVQYILFGCDISGNFVLDERNQSVHYVYKEFDEFKFILCNKGINEFINFNNLFLSVVSKQSINVNDEYLDDIIATIDKYFNEIDLVAMEDESNYWSVKLYELSGNFIL